ncbi:[LysW]-aminoadipate kinase [Corallococcus sp. AB049A]|uniref:[LysW]-aminoadipate kinase n=1 Tax=Corallococcus sp. AB049A TaxID=2316721 RepID=UPI000EA2A656|nr:[LysW]-aminoadipate kinase [Corallococcus sp. AB049A]RKH44052.1 [LysW]-aminoadipate kinase [Corallococcus sp. AB050B]RKI62618.1 [LysW]-aminoadipate kinase [Corallococcus sp. AB049A]
MSATAGASSRRPVVVKIGGAAGVDLENVCSDVAELVRQGERVVVVNGGSEAGERLLGSLGLERPEATTANGNVVRLTYAPTLRALTMAWVGEVNKAVVLALLSKGVTALGLCGADGRVLTARRRPPLKLQDSGGRMRIDREHLAGEVSSVNAALLGSLLDGGYVPVVCPPAVTEDGVLVNVDADHVASSIAAAVGAKALVILSNVPGLLADPKDPSSLVRSSDDVAGCMPLAGGRMRYKLEAVRRALEGGVPTAYVSASRVARPVFAALEEAGGTKFTLRDGGRADAGA